MWCLIVLAFLVSLSQAWIPGRDGSGSPDEIRAYYYRRLLLEQMPEVVEELAGLLLEPAAYEELMDEIEEIYSDPSTPYIDCSGCRAILQAVRGFLNQGLDYWDVRDQVLEICYRLVNESQPGGRYDIICPGACDNYGPHVMYVLNVSDDTVHEICTLHNNCDPNLDPEPTTEPPSEREVDPEVTSRRRPLRKRQSKPGKRDVEGALKLAFLTDIHIDAQYLEGEAVDCGMPLCCREVYPGVGEAEYWGEYDCNTPPYTVERMLRFVSELEPDIVVYTGDSPPNDIWDETQARQVNVTRWVAELISSHFPGVPAYASIGNHETYPTNLYYSPRPEIEEFNHEFAKSWEEMSGFTEEQLQTVGQAGYYSVPVPDLPGLRVITYNTNYGTTDNFYGALLQEDVGYRDMKDYIENEFEQAREDGEKVLLLGHHKSGASGMFGFFSRWISDVAIEYGDLISLHMMGHTHRDNFKMTTDLDTGEVYNVQLCAPAVTTRVSINPSVRIMYLDPDTYTPLDYDQYNMDLDLAMGSDEEPEVRLFYTASDEYNMTDLTPASYGDLVDRMEEDQELFDRYRYLETTGTNTPGPCTGTCLDNAMCGFRTTAYEDYKRCVGDWR